MICIKKGLNLPISGSPTYVVNECSSIKSVAVICEDYVGVKPSLKVREGDAVKKGQVLFEDKKNPGVLFTAPVAGKVSSINRGARRVLESVVIEASGSDQQSFKSYDKAAIGGLSREDVEANLLESGLWPSLRTRPYSKVPVPGSQPDAIFVTAMDTNPLAPSAFYVIDNDKEAFDAGLSAISCLTAKTVHVCAAPDPKLEIPSKENLKLSSFSGPHPAGLAGTHIHFLEPVGPGKCVWSIGYQDVIAIGRLFLTGSLDLTRMIAIGGTGVKNPMLYRTVVGASTEELTSGLLNSDTNRIISGSVLSGRTAQNTFAFLGKFHNQISVLREGTDREFLGWKMPGLGKFSVKRSHAGGWLPFKIFDFTTTTHGSLRAMVPIGCFEKVTPLDVESTFLLRSLIMTDCDRAVQLGALELDEEDVGLWSFVCPGKMDYAPMLRTVLDTVEADG